MPSDMLPPSALHPDPPSTTTHDTPPNPLAFPLTTSSPPLPPSSLAIQSYTKLARISAFTATPSITHFSGFTLTSPSTQKICLTNTSPTAKRLHIIPPTTPSFKARYEKSGVIAPGMSQIIYVDFYPTEHRYYYDAVRINAEPARPDSDGIAGKDRIYMKYNKKRSHTTHTTCFLSLLTFHSQTRITWSSLSTPIPASTPRAFPQE